MPKPLMKPFQLKYTLGITFSPQFPQCTIYVSSIRSIPIQHESEQMIDMSAQEVVSGSAFSEGVFEMSCPYDY